MSVSVSESAHGNQVDLNAIVSGGDAFMARLKALQEAKKQHDEALGKLRLGTDVVRAMQDVQAREQAALAAITEAGAHAEKLVAEARAEAHRLLAEATEKAEAIRAKAAAEGDALAREVDEARSALSEWSSRTRHEANTLMNAAVAAQKKAEARIADNERAATQASDLLAQAKASHTAADLRHAAMKQWLETLPPPPT